MAAGYPQSGGYRQLPPHNVMRPAATPAPSRFRQQSPGQPYPMQAGDNASQASDADAECGPLVKEHKPSHKVQAVAGDIAALEDRCQWLEERNAWLTKRLLQAQRRFIERSVLSSGRTILTRALEGWRSALHELHMEKQLDEQTRSLEQCQQVAHELGGALTHEQALRRSCSTAYANAREELQKAVEEEGMLKDRLRHGQRHLEFLEQRVNEAESSLERSRAEAQAIVDIVCAYERARRTMEDDQKIQPRQDNVLEHGMRSRQAAHGVMQKVTGLLKDQRQQVSPQAETFAW